MDIKKYLPKKVIVIEVPINAHVDNNKAVTDIVRQLKLDENKNILILGNDKIKYMRTKTKWF
jgi:DNA polymerase III psi subunit